MIIQRFTHKVKVGCKDELIEVLKAWSEEAGFTPRVSTHWIGPLDVVISDIEHASIEDHNKFWADYDWGQPQAVEWLEKWDDLRESGATNELLQVH